MNLNLYKPKLLHTAFVQVSGLAALAFGWLSGGEYVALTSIALGAYIIGNVAERKVQAQENIELKLMNASAVSDTPRADG